MSLEQKVQFLQVAASCTCGVRELVHRLRWKTSTIVSLSKKMNEEKLIEFHAVKQAGRGRPKKGIVCTALGLDFLETYRKLDMKHLRARKADLDRAAKDASYTQRLVENGHAPFELLMELNSIVRNIRDSSEAHQVV